MISAETILAVRERSDLLAVVGEHVPTLKRRGKSYVGLCPFHKEKSPSFHVNPDRGFYHCFGCKESGTAIDFVMKLEGATFPEAVRSLAERLGLEVDESREAPTEVDRQKRHKDDLYGVSQLAAVFFETQLREHPDRELALEELARRGLRPSWAGGANDADADEALQAFRLGYAPPEWDGLARFLKAQGISPLVAETAGLLVPKSSGAGHYDRFRHRLMFAVVDPQSRVVAFSGRALAPHPSDTRRDDKPAKYINSPETPIYSKGAMLFGVHAARHAIRAAEEAIVVEGNFDVVSLHARGVANVVAPLGTAFTLEQAKLLRRFAPAVVLLFDGDAAGKKAVRASQTPLREAGLSVRVATPPEGMDPDELVREKGADAVRELVGQARGMTEHLIEEALDASFVSADAYERVRRVEQVAQILRDEPNPLVRSMFKSYADQLAGRLDLQRSPEAFRTLEQTVRRAVADKPPPPPRSRRPGLPEEGEHEPSQQRPAEAFIKRRVSGAAERREIIGALIEHPGLLDDEEVDAMLQQDVVKGPSVHLVVALREAWDRRAGRLDSVEFLAQIDETFHSFVASRLAAPLHESEEDAKRHLLKNAKQLKSLLLGEEAENLARENYKPEIEWETQTELAKEAASRVKARQGIKE